MTETGSDLKGAEKRRRIVEAAWRLVRRQGLRGMTMEALAREAGIAKATLYGQFADKEAVYTGVIDEMIVDLQRAFDSDAAVRAWVQTQPEKVKTFSELLAKRYPEKWKTYATGVTK